MALEIAIEEFLAALRQSGLLPSGGEDALLAELAEQGAKPADARCLTEELIRREILTAWQAENLLQGKHRGFHLGPYVMLRPLGQGAMGSVFLARHVVMNRLCAIKILPSKYREDPDLLNRFQTEARAIAALDHPNIVRAYDFNKDASSGSEMYYLVMEYVEGQDLQRMVAKEGALEYQRAADFIRQAAVGLAHAHEAGFVHRDIKPANLLVDGKGTLKILDLGLAQFASEACKASRTEPSVSGTPDYIAPEQIADSPGLDGRADIYSLGLTFYFLLVGRRPFVKATLPEILTAHRSERPAPIGQTRPDVPFELTNIIEKMTAKAPEQRYKTAGDVAAALQTWLDNVAGGQASRLSAIRLAAMRSRQRVAADSADANLQAAAGPDLELAPLQEQPSQPAVSVPEGAGSSQRSRTSKKDVPPPADREQGRTAAAKPAPNPASPPTSPAAATPTALDYLLTQLPPESAASAMLGASPAASSGAHARLRPGARAARGAPWFWVGVGGLLFAACMLVFLVLLLAFQSSPQGIGLRQESPSSAPTISPGNRGSGAKPAGPN
jgi:serine/threonine-protein kinase